MSELNLLKERLGQAIVLVKESVDISIEIIKKGASKDVTGLWEEFLSVFIKHIRLKSRESGKNLLANINFSRIWR